MKNNLTQLGFKQPPTYAVDALQTVQILVGLSYFFP